MKLPTALLASLAMGSGLLAGTAQAGYLWYDDFDGASLDSRWTADTTSGNTSITFNGSQSRVDFATTTATNMWTSRSNAPILWTTAPNLDSILALEFEGKVTMVSDQPTQIAGLMVWNGSSATSGARAVQYHEWPTQGVETASLQVFGSGTVAQTGDLSVQELWLKLRWDKDAGSGGTDLWTGFYATSDPTISGWTQLSSTSSGDYAFDRLGLFLKSGTDTAREAYFEYAALTVIAPEPSTVVQLVAGLCTLACWSWRRRAYGGKR